MEFVHSGVYRSKRKCERKINFDPRLSLVGDKNTTAFYKKMAAARGLNDATSPSDGANTKRMVQKAFILIKKTDAHFIILIVFDCHLLLLVIRVISN